MPQYVYSTQTTHVVLYGMHTTRKEVYDSIEARSLRSRTRAVYLVDYLISITGTPLFLIINVLLFGLWIMANTGLFNFVEIFDPYPFGMLTMMVSLEAIILSILVLISQNRTSTIDTIREEVQMRLNIISEQEVTKVLELLIKVAHKVGVDPQDPELVRMLKKINTQELETDILSEIKTADHIHETS